MAAGGGRAWCSFVERRKGAAANYVLWIHGKGGCYTGCPLDARASRGHPANVLDPIHELAGQRCGGATTGAVAGRERVKNRSCGGYLAFLRSKPFTEGTSRFPRAKPFMERTFCTCRRARGTVRHHAGMNTRRRSPPRNSGSTSPCASAQQRRRFSALSPISLRRAPRPRGPSSC